MKNNITSGEFIRRHTPDSDPPEGRGIAIFVAWAILSFLVVLGFLVARLFGG